MDACKSLGIALVEDKVNDTLLLHPWSKFLGLLKHSANPGCHMVACASWGHIASALHLVPQQRVHSRWQLVKIAVLASVFCLTVVMGNISLRYIPVSFNQV